MPKGNLSKLNKLEQAMIEDLKNSLPKKLKNGVVLIRLFGSKARGDYNDEQDQNMGVLK
ncbi:nucleotidyltransferase domain-containing protein [Patescibacteria group bacterium]|nr:nucleotidyltransferase domain-containing protein [Patescibacteria group bacterium]